jgi:diguanylate cyclase (GGDEF)-like protein/putative nucleotidyltransferase with HDIG domain
MNIYAFFPLVATLAYIPLLLTTASSRPWNKRLTLFLIFLVSAMVWSLADYFWRSGLFPEYYLPLGRVIVVLFVLMAVQYHCFASSFFAPGQGRWLPFAYSALAIVIGLAAAGLLPEDIIVDGDKLHPVYGWEIVILGIPLIVLLVRTVYFFWKRLKVLNNPTLYSQIVSLLFGLGTLSVFTLIAVFPWGREYPVSHFGSLINAFILSYAVIRHRLVDIRIVLRQGTAWLTLGIIGSISFWLMLIFFHSIFDFNLDLTASFIAIIASLVVAIIIYKVRGYFFDLTNRAFQGPNYDYRIKLSEFADKIHNVFSLKEQGAELLSLLVQAIDVKKACLLFPEIGTEDFKTQFTQPDVAGNDLASFRLSAKNPVIQYLQREQKTLSRDNIDVLPSFLSLWLQEKEDIESRDIEIFVPLISRDRLIAVLVLGKKLSGRYSLADLNLIEYITERVAVSIEKEYLREELREREQELSVINSSSAILASSLDIQEIFGSFIEELKSVIDVYWASIVLVEEDELRCAALTPLEGMEYKVGDKLPMDGTGTGWVVTYRKSFIENDLSKEVHFTTGENFYERGLRTVAYLPLVAKARVIGSFIVASHYPNAYSQRHIKLLEQLASQIAMPLENAQLYAKAEEKARIDELTGLFNRRSLDEVIDSEISRHSRYGGTFSLAILDLDSFKAYNDSFGHLSGDTLLRQVGDIIRGTIRNSDQAFRYGGDEFAILLPQTDIDAGLNVIERVRQKIAAAFDSGEIPITASIGVASWPDDGISHTDIIAAADVTLYRAKRSGGNQIYCASGSLPALQLDEAVGEKAHKVDNRILSVVYALSETVESKSPYMYNHSKKVAEYALALAKALKLEPAEMSKLEICALLHDIGKVTISDTIVNKEGELTEEEWESVKSHSQMGAALAKRVPQLAACADGILHHHEWYDGSGYPDGLKGDNIPLEARILAIADAFTAMTSETSYSETLTHEQALEELKRRAGTQFDPELVEHFVSIFKGNLVRTRKKARR